MNIYIYSIPDPGDPFLGKLRCTRRCC